MYIYIYIYISIKCIFRIYLVHSKIYYILFGTAEPMPSPVQHGRSDLILFCLWTTKCNWMLRRLFLNTRTFKQLNQVICTRSNSSGIGPPNFKTSGSFLSVPRLPSSPPTFQPSFQPAFQPSSPPTFQPSFQPAFQPSSLPALQPSSLPALQRSSLQPSSLPPPAFQPSRLEGWSF